MAYSINWELKGVHCKCFGSVSASEIKALADAVVNDPRFATLDYRITDCLDICQIDASHAGIDEVIVLNEAYSFSNARKYEAAVATNTDVLSLLRYWASTSPRQLQLCIFSTLADARRWLLNPEVL